MGTSEFKAKILGRVWRIVSVPELHKQFGCWGDTDPPSTAGKAIRYDSSLSPWEKVEVVSHEVTHAAFPCLDESYVQSFGEDLRAILERVLTEGEGQ